MVVVNNADPCVLLIIGHSAENVEIRLRDFKVMIMTMEMITIIMMTMMIRTMDTLWEMVMFDKMIMMVILIVVMIMMIVTTTLHLDTEHLRGGLPCGRSSNPWRHRRPGSASAAVSSQTGIKKHLIVILIVIVVVIISTPQNTLP